MEGLETHKENALSTDHPSVRFNQQRGIVQSYQIRGSVDIKSKYSNTRSGEVKHYDKIYNDNVTFNRTIRAVS